MRVLAVGMGCWTIITHARGAVISYTRSENRFGLGVLGSLEIPKFDPIAGRLDSLSIQIDSISQVSATAEGMNAGDTVDVATVQFQATMRVIDLNGTISAFVAPNPMWFDHTDGTFHFVEGDKPVVIELRTKLVDVLPWSVRYETGTNAPGTLVKLPLEVKPGFIEYDSPICRQYGRLSEFSCAVL